MTTTPIQQALLPCPFCGAPAYDFNPDGDMEGYHIGCSGQSSIFNAGENDCPMHTFSYTKYEDAKTAWNRRALSQVASEPVEPVAWLHKQGNHTEASDRRLDDDEIARGWTQEPLYASPQPAVQQEKEQAQREKMNERFRDRKGPRSVEAEFPPTFNADQQSSAPEASEQDAMALALMERLVPHALTGGKMSLIEAFEHGWQAARQARPCVPEWMTKIIRREVEIAKNPTGMSTHSGKVTLDISHVERLLIAAAPSVQSNDSARKE